MPDHPQDVPTYYSYAEVHEPSYSQYPNYEDANINCHANYAPQNPVWINSDGFHDIHAMAVASMPTYTPNLPLYAPVPLPGYPSVLSSCPSHHPYVYDHYDHLLPPTISASPYVDSPTAIDVSAAIEEFSNSSAAQIMPVETFPTPSELLKEISVNDPTAPVSPCEALVPTPASIGDPSTLQRPKSAKIQPENSRKARQRAVAKAVGFEPTDPDSISSHEKKRHYLECLEYYVTYLHEQIRLVNSEPVPLERVSNHRGLSSRSIRTLLVHMETTARALNLKTLAAEQEFLRLREHVLEQTCENEGSA